MKIDVKTGDRYGRLMISREIDSKICNRSSKGTFNKRRFLCKCDCGNEKKLFLVNLRAGTTKSCGCLKKYLDKKGTHLKTGSREYRSWGSMKQRCTNKNAKEYNNYGGRGIKICEEWLDNFETFYKDMGDRPEGTSIDRIDNNGNYTLGNCRWSTRKEQQNNMRNVKKYKFKNQTMTISEWSQKISIESHTLYTRVRRGWGFKRAIETPVNKKRYN